MKIRAEFICFEDIFEFMNVRAELICVSRPLSL